MRCVWSSQQYTDLKYFTLILQEAELLEGAEELEKLERQVRSSAGRGASHDWRLSGDGRRTSGPQDASEEPLLDR